MPAPFPAPIQTPRGLKPEHELGILINQGADIAVPFFFNNILKQYFTNIKGNSYALGNNLVNKTHVVIPEIDGIFNVFPKGSGPYTNKPSS